MSSSPFHLGDRVRFERYGEWLDGVVIALRVGMICVEYGPHKATTWRFSKSPNVRLTSRV